MEERGAAGGPLSDCGSTVSHYKGSFGAVTVHSPSTLRMQTFDVATHSKAFQTSYELDGLLSGFVLSHDYILAVSDQGFYYIFKLSTGELRGKVPVPGDPVGLAVDPSGLYLATSVRSNVLREERSVSAKAWTMRREDDPLSL